MRGPAASGGGAAERRPTQTFKETHMPADLENPSRHRSALDEAVIQASVIGAVACAILLTLLVFLG